MVGMSYQYMPLLKSIDRVAANFLHNISLTALLLFVFRIFFQCNLTGVNCSDIISLKNLFNFSESFPGYRRVT